jgi:hypothetical protein
MLRSISVVAIAALIMGLTIFAAAAKPGNKGNKGGAMHGLDRADYVAGVHGAYGRKNARSRGWRNGPYHCPPGQAKKGRC